jgi:glycosyltransferase involved in cell wall biosynthesis
VAGVPEVVAHEETGLLVTSGRVEELASAVVRLLQDREARALMGKQAAERCRSLFDISVVAPRYLDLYRELAR